MSTVLVINSGSSSIKYQLINPVSGDVLAKGIVERIGEPVGIITHKHAGEELVRKEPVPDHGDGLQKVLAIFDEVGPTLAEAGIVAVGHRIVQGGSYFDGPALVDDHVRALIEKLCTLAPLHNPAHLKGIDVARELMPDVPHVAVFDTAFFQHLPEASAMYAIDRDVARQYGIRRYGAHGTSHQFVSEEVSKMLGRDDLKQIVLHLGNGASASAVDSGRAIDTSMGLTPLEGLLMGTRSGDIDPAVVFHLQREAGMTVDQVDEFLNKRSGMKGMTGEADMRTNWELIENGPEEISKRARAGMDVYIHRLVKYVGAYWTELGGLDALTFTAGIGENDPGVREELCDALAPFGVKINHDLNWENWHVKAPIVLSHPDSSVTVLCYPTNEELAIARQALSLAQHD